MDGDTATRRRGERRSDLTRILDAETDGVGRDPSSETKKPGVCVCVPAISNSRGGSQVKSGEEKPGTAVGGRGQPP
jgi:hypothetical protein